MMIVKVLEPATNNDSSPFSQHVWLVIKRESLTYSAKIYGVLFEASSIQELGKKIAERYDPPTPIGLIANHLTQDDWVEALSNSFDVVQEREIGSTSWFKLLT